MLPLREETSSSKVLLAPWLQEASELYEGFSMMFGTSSICSKSSPDPERENSDQLCPVWVEDTSSPCIGGHLSDGSCEGLRSSPAKERSPWTPLRRIPQEGKRPRVWAPRPPTGLSRFKRGNPLVPRGNTRVKLTHPERPTVSPRVDEEHPGPEGV